MAHVFSWNSRKQDIVAQLTAEAEYIATVEAINQAIWIRKIMNDLSQKQKGPTDILCDNQSTIAIVKNPVFHGKTKHMKMKNYFARDAEKEVKLIYCSFENQLVDILAKALPKAKFETLRKSLGVCSKSVKEEC